MPKTKSRKLLILFCLTTAFILGIFFGIFGLYLTFFPVGVVDNLWESSPNFFAGLEWQSWTPADQWKEETMAFDKEYTAFRKGTYTTCFYHFDLVQGKQASDPQKIDHLPRHITCHVRRNRVILTVTLATFFICALNFCFFTVVKWRLGKKTHDQN